MFFKILLSDNPSTKIYKLLFLIIISAITFFNHISISPLGFDDVFYAQKAKEMVLNKNWFYTYPTHGGRISFDNKPPALFWILGLAGSLFGFSDGAMRFFPALFGVFTIIALFFFATYLSKSSLSGFLSAFICLFTQQFIYYSRSATPETLYTLLWILSLWCFKKALEEGNTLFYYLGGFITGLAVMTRNLPALLIYFTFIVYVFSVGELHKLMSSKPFYTAILITILVSAPWHIIMIFLYKKSFIESYFGVLVRYGFQTSSEWYEYIKKILENYWPWLPFFVISLYRILKKFSLTPLESKISSSLTKNNALFILAMIIPYYIFIQAASFRAPQYLVPLYPFMAILSAEGVIIVGKKISTIPKILVATGTFLALLWFLFPILPDTMDSKEFRHLVKLKDTVQYIDRPIYTPDAPDLWHFRNGLLFYSGKDILPAISTNTAINWLNSPSMPPYYFIIKKRHLPSYFNNRLKDINSTIIAETEESVLLSNKKGYKNFTAKSP